MTAERKVETTTGIQEQDTVQLYDRMQRKFRDRGWMEHRAIVASGMDSGRALEIGPGPGYLGLEWLSSTTGTTLEAIEISPAMIETARRNAHEYGLEDRAAYVEGNACSLPFEDGRFDAVFSNGSLHEWEDPLAILGEAHRVVREGGKLFVSDLRRDMPLPLRAFLWLMTYPRAMRSGLASSIAAAYTTAELTQLVARSPFREYSVSTNLIGLQLTAVRR